MKKDKKYFSGQGNDEQIIKLLHKHSCILVQNEIMPGIIFLVTVVLMTFFFHMYTPYVFLISFVVFLFSIVWGYYHYFTWVKDKYIITNQRILDIEQITFFNRSQREAPLEKIQDVTFEIKGPLGASFNFGTITIQTAGESSLTLDDIPDPEKNQKIIFDLIREKQNNQKGDDKGLIGKMLDMLKSMGASEEKIKAELEKSTGNDIIIEEREDAVDEIKKKKFDI